MGMCEGEERMGLGLGSSSSSCSSNTSAYHSSVSSSAATPIGSSNIGFQLLKKHGWKEGTGLGVCEQLLVLFPSVPPPAQHRYFLLKLRQSWGRLEPIQAYLKKNKRGLGADEIKLKSEDSKKKENHASDGTSY
ncbi:unnamed protein product [Ilex paraguariensis]|uniref:G-patch domain-containing protein n=1 Tax=Ilex paraguariensis TaxID=185542 RepID=A0ABC8RPK3_9AQUA